ncbi:hypothetical protein [Actinomadura nitritigenes]|uniref:hypothetical protein n=1 Tax=Actinomadura nitritigenes TaxID=134602 RepID=UPI003D925B94
MGSSGTIDSLRRMEPEPLLGVRRSRRWPVLLIGGCVVQVGIRLLFAVHQKTPILIPDETGYLLAARLMAGGAAGDLSGWPLYQAGYPLLISPAFWLSDDPATVYGLVTVINSLFGASLLVLAYVALRRLDLSRAQAYVIATVTALLPSVIYYGQFAMADAVLPVVVLGWLLLVHTWIASGRWGYGAAASALAAYCYCVHSRGSIIVVVHAGLLTVALWRRWAGKRDIAAAVGVLVAGAAAGWTLNGWVQSKIYPGGVKPLGDFLVARLTSLDGLAWTLSLAAGKVWFLIVSTCGVAGAGLVVVGALAVRRATPRPTRATSWVVLAALTGIAIASSAAVPDEGTVANFVYGRYLGCLTPVLFMAGAAFAVRGTREAVDRAVLATTCLTLAAVGVVWWYAGKRLSRSFFSVFEFPEISFLTWSWDALRLWSATCAALFLLALAGLVVSKYRQAGALAAAAAFIVFALADMAVVSKRVVRYWEGELESATSLAPAGLQAHDHVALDYSGLSWRIWVSQAFQVRTGLEPLDRFRRETLPRDATLVVVPWDALLPQRPEDSWPSAPPNWHPVSIRTTYAGGWVAWRPGR